MPFSLQHKCLFIHIPRTGGSSFRTALKIKEQDPTTIVSELSDCYELSLNEMNLPTHLQLQHLCMKQIQMLGMLDHSLITESLKVSFIRNPWDKALSAYSHHYHKNSIDFEDYIVQLEKIVSFINENFVFDLEDIFYKEYSDLVLSTLSDVINDRFFWVGPGPRTKTKRKIINDRVVWVGFREVDLDKLIWVDPHFFPQHLFIYDEFDNVLLNLLLFQLVLYLHQFLNLPI